jgi:hypothetical protein
VTTLVVHQMVLKLENHGLIDRVPRTPWSIRVIAPTDELHRLL